MESGGPAPGEESDRHAPGEEAGGPAPGEAVGGPAPGEAVGRPAPGEDVGRPAPGEELGGPAPGEAVGRPAPGEELNRDAETVPRRAATVILLRGGSERLEVLLVRRNPDARFMGGAWVFPGGAVGRDEGEGDGALRAAALRELAEEAGIALDSADQLVPFSRWITPAEVKIRFDTWFYLAPAPDGAEARVDGGEVVDARWYEPEAALEAGRAGELLLVFPTIKHLEQLAGFDSAQALMAHARGREIRPVQPRVVVSGETARIVLPGEPGYED